LTALIPPASIAPAVAAVATSSPKLERLTGLVWMVSPVTPVPSGITMAGLLSLLVCALTDIGACGALGGCRFCVAVAAEFGLACLDVLCRYCRSSDNDMAPGAGCGECRGDSPRGELVRCVPKVAPPCALRAVEPGVVGPLGAAKGPVCVGVMALVVAAMDKTMEKMAYGILMAR
jgi:hypothetical protein